MTDHYTTTFEKTAPGHWYSAVREHNSGAGWTFGPFQTKKRAREYADNFIESMKDDN